MALYYEDIYNLCSLRLVKEDDVCDVVQEVFLLFQQRYESLDESMIKSWLYNVANKKIQEKFKHIARREKELILGANLDEIEDFGKTYTIEPDDLITSEEIENKKKDIMATLTEKELRLFEMVYVRHMEYEQLAKTLGISVNTARTRVYRLNLKIKEKVTYAFMVILLLLMKI